MTHPFNSPARLALIMSACVLLSLLEAGMLVAASRDLANAPALFILFGAIGLTWGLLALAIAALSGRGPLIHLAGFLFCAAIDTVVRQQVTLALGAQLTLPWFGAMFYYADRTIIAYVAIVLAIKAFEAHDLLIARRRQTLALEAELAHARIASLEDQLHPHFLFNALGAVTELAASAPAQASRILDNLASVLRFSLKRRGAEVTLREELEALEPYLEVQRMRFADWISIDVEVDPEAESILTPPMVLQPLVENSIRHGLSGRRERGRIVINATAREGRLLIQVRDNGAGLNASQFEGHGIGLSNIRQRVTLLHADNAGLTLSNEPGGGTTAQLDLPARLASPIAASRADLSSRAERETPLTSRTNLLTRHPRLAMTAAWAVWGVLWSQQSIGYLAFRGRLAGQSVTTIVMRDFVTVMLWAPLTPLMLLMLRRVPLRSQGLLWRIAAHLAAALAIASLHGYLAQLVTGIDLSGFSVSTVGELIWGVFAYAVVLAVGYQESIRSWLVERDLVESTMRSRLADAELATATSHARPQELLARLDEIGQMIHTDAHAAERALAQLGDRLRQSLDEMVPA